MRPPLHGISSRIESPFFGRRRPRLPTPSSSLGPHTPCVEIELLLRIAACLIHTSFSHFSSPSLTHSLCLTRLPSQSLVSRTHTRCVSHLLSLSTLVVSHPRCLSYTLSLTHTHSFSVSLVLPLTCSLSPVLPLTCSLSHTLWWSLSVFSIVIPLTLVASSLSDTRSPSHSFSLPFVSLSHSLSLLSFSLSSFSQSRYPSF